MPSRRGDGTLVFKICFYGPSLGGKTTALEWVYNREGLASGDMQQIQDPTGRTLFFDRVVARVSNVVFQVYTVAGQRRHKFQRQTVLTSNSFKGYRCCDIYMGQPNRSVGREYLVS